MHVKAQLRQVPGQAICVWPGDLLHRPGAANVLSHQLQQLSVIIPQALPFRGFSLSGATISTGMLTNVSRLSAERSPSHSRLSSPHQSCSGKRCDYVPHRR